MGLVLVFALSCSDPYVFIKSDHTPARMQARRLWNNHSYEFRGYVNGNGTFICEEIIWLNPPSLSKRESPKDMRPQKQMGPSTKRNDDYDLLNAPLNTDEYPDGECYEYRSGLLIPGRLTRSYEFVPDKDGKIIEMKDYVYSEKAKRIYNLPGKFVRYSEDQKLKQEKK